MGASPEDSARLRQTVVPCACNPSRLPASPAFSIPSPVPFDSKMLFALVKERTGYPVVVMPMEGNSGHVSMRSAGRDNPSHLIFLNPAYERFANYLIATQSALILLKFGDPARVFDFTGFDEKTAKLAASVGTELQEKGVAKAEAPKMAEFLVRRLMLLLTSAPLEILAMRWCYNEWPDLRGEQTNYITMYLRELSAGLAPALRQQFPSTIYDRVTKMNAAYTLAWAELSGERGGLLPYEALGYAKPGQELLNDLEGFSVETPDVYRRSVDAWASRLDLEGWYRWSPRQT
jgi:hypothetical protein